MNEVEKKIVSLVMEYLEAEGDVSFYLSSEISELTKTHNEDELMPVLYKVAAALYWDWETYDECEIQEGSTIAEVVTGIYWSAKEQAKKAILNTLGLDIDNSGGYLCDIMYSGDTPLLDEDGGRKKLLTELIDDLTKVRDSI